MASPHSIQISQLSNQSSVSPRSSIICRPPSAIAIRKKPSRSNLRLVIGVAGQEADHHQRRDDADRQVDEEHPAPVEIVGQPAAEHRAEDRPDHHARAEQRHRAAMLFGRVDVEHHGLGERHEKGAGNALDDAEADHHHEALRDRTEQRGDGEDDHRPDEEPLAADPFGEPAGDRNRDRGGDDIGGQHPGDRLAGRAEAGLHVRQRDVRDRLVEHLHQHRQDHGDRREAPLGGGHVVGVGHCGRR